MYSHWVSFVLNSLKRVDDQGLHWIGDLAHNILFREQALTPRQRIKLKKFSKKERKAFEKIGTRSTPNKIRKRLVIQQVRKTFDITNNKILFSPFYIFSFKNGTGLFTTLLTIGVPILTSLLGLAKSK